MRASKSSGETLKYTSVQSIRVRTVDKSTYSARSMRIQRPGEPGNVREFRCKEKNSGKSQRILFCEIHFHQSEHLNFDPS